MRGFAGTRSALLASFLIAALLPTMASAAPRNFWGVHPNYQVTPLNGGDYDRMRSARVGTMRFQLNWNQTEPVRDGAYQWGRIDPIMANLARKGIEPRPFIYGTPSWAGKSALHQPSGRQGNLEWQEFLRDVMRRYGRGGSFWSQPGAPPAQPIKVVQILNEVNSSKYYKPGPNPRKYGQFIKISSKAIKSVNRRAKVLLAGMFGTPISRGAIPAWRFLSKLYRVPKVEKYFDGVAVHPYSPNLRGIRYQMHKMRSVIKKNRDRRTKLYATELGWGSAKGGRKSLSKGRRGQARMLKSSFRMLHKGRKRWNLAGVTWYSWADPASSSDPCTWCRTSGLLDEGGNAKPSLSAFRSAAR